MDNTQNDIPLPQRMGNLEAMLHSVVNTLDVLKPFLAGIPVVGTAVVAADAVGHVVEAVVDIAQGENTTDAAALAAGNISVSTGDTSLDARLMQIETFIAAAAPLLKAIAHHFGFDAPAPFVAPAPMALSPEVNA